MYKLCVPADQNRECSIKALDGPRICSVYSLLLQAATALSNHSEPCRKTAHAADFQEQHRTLWANHTMLIATDIQHSWNKKKNTQFELLKILCTVESAVLPPLGALPSLTLPPFIFRPDVEVTWALPCCRSFTVSCSGAGES